MDITAWLRELGLERYQQEFHENEIDAEILPKLTAGDLKDIGVTAVGHRRKLLEAIAALADSALLPQADPSAWADRKPRARPAEAERRQLTVLFCDLVGSTALSAKLDPEDMSQVMRTYQNCCAEGIKRWDGHIAKYLGDGVLAYFGWPRAHEDEAERAVLAGLDITDAVGRLTAGEGTPLSARIGIATGLVMVGDLIGEGAAQEETVVGETPNVAARLQALAKPGQVMIAEGTRRLLGSQFDLQDLGRRELKGISVPAGTFAVLGERMTESRFEARSGSWLLPMVGRDQELALLQACWARVEAGEGQGVVLVGEAGIGKSRLVRALSDAIADQPHTRIYYQCSPYHHDSALWPVIQQLGHATGLASTEPQQARLDKLETLLARASNDVAVVAPLFASLLGIDGTGRYGTLDLTPQAQRARTLDALVEQLLGLAAERPVLLVLEDAHWIDPTTLELIDQCLERGAKLPVLILLTTRPEQQPSLAGHPHVTRLTLARLGRPGVEAMVAELWGEMAVPSDVKEKIVDGTDGVPLFVEELTKAVLETGETTIPTSLHDTLMARLDRLSSVKEIAQIGACIGREFPHDLLAVVAERSGPDLHADLERLASAELIFRRGTSPAATYSFKHALLQNAAYQSLLKSKRKKLHARIATALEEHTSGIADTEPELLAHHHAEAGALDQSIRYSQKAGQRAVERSANVEAGNHIRRALTLARQQTGSQRDVAMEVELHLRLGAVLSATEGHASDDALEQYDTAKTLCELGGNVHQSFQAIRGLHMGVLNRGDYEHSTTLASQLVDTANRSNRSDHLLMAWYSQAVTLFYGGDLQAACRLFEQAASVYEPHRNSEYTLEYGSDTGLWSLSYKALIEDLSGHRDRALASMNEVVTMARDFGNRLHLGAALTAISILHHFRREPNADGQYAEEAISIGRDQELPQCVAFGRAHAGWALSMQGRSENGILLLLEGLGGLRSVSHKFGEPHVLAMLAQAYRQASQLDDALGVLDEGLTIATEANHLTFIVDLYRQRGCCLVSKCCSERSGSGESDLQTAIEIARRQGARTYELRCATDLARLWAEHGERQKGHDLLASIYDWFTEGFDTTDLKDAKALLDELA